MKKKCIRLEIRLTPDESQMFQNKAQNYGGNMSAMVRDAVRYAFRSKCSQFLALRVKRKLFTI